MEWLKLNTTHTIYILLRFSEPTTVLEGMPINLLFHSLNFTRVVDVISRKRNTSSVTLFMATVMKKSTLLSPLYPPSLTKISINKNYFNIVFSLK